MQLHQVLALWNPCNHTRRTVRENDGQTVCYFCISSIPKSFSVDKKTSYFRLGMSLCVKVIYPYNPLKFGRIFRITCGIWFILHFSPNSFMVLYLSLLLSIINFFTFYVGVRCSWFIVFNLLFCGTNEVCIKTYGFHCIYPRRNNTFISICFLFNTFYKLVLLDNSWFYLKKYRIRLKLKVVYSCLFY